MAYEENYKSLLSEYLDARSLMSKKVNIVDSYIDIGGSLLDIGVGTGELVELEKHKFDRVYGIDMSKESIDLCSRRFEEDQNITLIQSDITALSHYFKSGQFDCVTCLDILEHIDLKECKKTLSTIMDLLYDGGKFIFTGPGLREKVRIRLGRSYHVHSHSSYGWERILKQAGLIVTSVETVEFPIIHSEFLRKKLHLFGKCCLIVARK